MPQMSYYVQVPTQNKSYQLLFKCHHHSHIQSLILPPGLPIGVLDDILKNTNQNALLCICQCGINNHCISDFEHAFLSFFSFTPYPADLFLKDLESEEDFPLDISQIFRDVKTSIKTLEHRIWHFCTALLTQRSFPQQYDQNLKQTTKGGYSPVVLRKHFNFQVIV